MKYLGALAQVFEHVLQLCDSTLWQLTSVRGGEAVDPDDDVQAAHAEDMLLKQTGSMVQDRNVQAHVGAQLHCQAMHNNSGLVAPPAI